MSLVVRSAAVSLSSSRPSVALEALEGRTLFHLAEISQIADFSVLNSSAPTQINLNSHFDNEDFDGTLVRMTSVLGNIDIELFDGLKPQSVSNFLNNYVDTDRYNNSIIHRSDSLDSLTVTPKEILQGGGFSFPGFTSVATGADPTVPNEFTTNGVISNTRGTLAYAKGSDPDSATSQWFLNLADNSAGLDNPANAGGFTVFGQLVNGTLSTADAIAALQTFAFADPFGALPLRDYTTFPSTPTADNVVLISDVSRLPETTYTAISDNAAVTPTVDANGVLSLAYAPGITGTAEITVVATALDGDSEKQTFDVTVNAGSSVPSSFGIALGTGGAKKVKFTDADGTAVEISAKKGAVTVRFSADNFQQSESKGTVTLTGTNIVVDGLVITQSNSTEITVKTKNGDGLVSIGDISADGTVKKISAKGVNLFGDVGIAGDLKDASFNSVGTGTFTAANFGKVKITGAFAANVGGGSIKEFKSGSITSGTWGLTGGASKVRTGVVDSSAGFVAAFNGEVKEFRVDGDADVDLTASRIKKLKIGGRLHDGDLTLTRTVAEGSKALDELSVGGLIEDFVITSAGHVGKVKASGMVDSRLHAASTPLNAGALLPTTAGEFTAAAQVKEVSLKGAATNFANSAISGFDLQKIKLGVIQLENNSTTFGVAAGTIKEVTGTTPAGQSFKFKKLDTSAELTAQATPTGIIFDEFSIVLI